MNAILKKIHMYLGLLSFSILLVFGIVGAVILFRPAPEQRVRPAPVVRYEAYTPPPNMSDKQVADHIWETLQPPMTATQPEFAIRRDGDNNLTVSFYSPNGIWRVTALEKENRLRVETLRNTFSQYLNALHETTVRNRAPDLRMRLWTYYNEFSIWTLIAMSVTGVYLWLSSRPGYRWAQISFALGCGSFGLLYFLTR